MADKFLIAAAVEARAKAYAPYSRFLVGAAVKDEYGAIHAGCNVENAAYPQGLCAEASAIGNMIAAGQDQFQQHPHLVFIPASALFLTVLALNRLGEAARRRLDPREAKI